MMKFGKRIAAMAMAGAMVLSLAACDDGGLSADDAKECVQVEMDTTYLGKFDGFLEYYSNVTKTDAQDQYMANISGEADVFLYAYGPTDPEDTTTRVPAGDDVMTRAEDIFKDIYAKASYEITSSTKQDDGTFAVKVAIKPIDIIKQVDDSMEAYFADFIEKFSTVDTESMTDEDFLTWYRDEYAVEYYDTLLDLLESKVSSIGYLDEKTIVIQVDMDENDTLILTDDDWANLDNLIIDYNMGAGSSTEE